MAFLVSDSPSNNSSSRALPKNGFPETGSGGNSWKKERLLKKIPSGVFPSQWATLRWGSSAAEAFSSSCPTSSSSLRMNHPHRAPAGSGTAGAKGAPRKRVAAAAGSFWGSTGAMLVVAVTLLLSATAAEGKHAWERPGCHKVGHTRKVTIPECMEFTITTNACRGYCESFAVPSAWYRLQNNPSQAITSVGQCCNIMETEDVTVSVWCVEGQKELVFKSAKSCACYHCKKD